MPRRFLQGLVGEAGLDRVDGQHVREARGEVPEHSDAVAADVEPGYSPAVGLSPIARRHAEICPMCVPSCEVSM